MLPWHHMKWHWSCLVGNFKAALLVSLWHHWRLEGFRRSRLSRNLAQTPVMDEEDDDEKIWKSMVKPRYERTSARRPLNVLAHLHLVSKYCHEGRRGGGTLPAQPTAPLTSDSATRAPAGGGTCAPPRSNQRYRLCIERRRNLRAGN